MARPLALDLFCNAGGAGTGLVRAGFEVTGVDIEPQPDNPHAFVQGDVFEMVQDMAAEIREAFVFVHASPPCQHGAAITKGTNRHLQHTYPNLYKPTVRLLDWLGLPYSIENTYARPDVVLCGATLGLGVIRHRKFQLGRWVTDRPVHRKHEGYTRGWRHGVYRQGPYVAAYGKGGGKATVPEMQRAMEIDWVHDRSHLVEMIPPAYTQWIGRRFLDR